MPRTTKTLTIMFTDIKGFTDRTSKSSRDQLKKMLDLHDELICPFFNEFGGEIVKTIGDAFMVTFHSPTDAVLCGIKIQNELDKHNEDLPNDEKLEIRVAINTGEVTIKDNDVFGEAVNIAARLEGIADAGDIYFTESVYLSMNKAEIPTASVGYRHFKGIPEEIKVYKVLREGMKKKGLFAKKDKQIIRHHSSRKKFNWKKILKWIGIIFLILFVIGAISNNQQKQEEEKQKAQALAQELEQLKDDAQQHALNNNIPALRNDLEKLKDLSSRIGYPAELERFITQFELKLDQIESQKIKITPEMVQK